MRTKCQETVNPTVVTTTMHAGYARYAPHDITTHESPSSSSANTPDTRRHTRQRSIQAPVHRASMTVRNRNHMVVHKQDAKCNAQHTAHRTAHLAN
jgi:hypothetical protein